MNPFREFNLFDFTRYIIYSYLPNRNDNFKQAVIKLLFIVSLAVFIISGIFIATYFLSAEKQENIIEDSRAIWHETVDLEAVLPESETVIYEETLTPQIALMRQNPDFKGWITIGNTQIDNPIYQTDNNDYYLNYNQKRERSAYGALYFDYRNSITSDKIDKNLVIYGHEMKNGSMFGELKKLRSLDFYKANPTIEFSTLYDSSTYKIFAVFVLNADREDDGGKMFNILGQDFTTEEAYDIWINDAKERSLINTNVDVRLGDDTITLVTCSSDFENSRLVVMARKTRSGESTYVDTSNTVLNSNPKYPKRWYDDRKIEYPY